MELLQAGVDRAVIALWLGHESVETTQIYLDADLALKEQALALRQYARSFGGLDKCALPIFVQNRGRNTTCALDPNLVPAVQWPPLSQWTRAKPQANRSSDRPMCRGTVSRITVKGAL
jgi:hypothetical protein